MKGSRSAAWWRGVELEGGHRSSPWRLLRDLRLWKDDALLTPVLIFDQFEELFTLHDADVRARFVRELAPILRGRAPESEGRIEEEADAAPPRLLKVIFSLREIRDLEALTPEVPHILNTRFLQVHCHGGATVTGVVRPSTIKIRSAPTRPFSFTPGTVDQMLRTS